MAESNHSSRGTWTGGVGVALSGSHVLFCPIHGVIPNTIYLAGATGSALAQHPIAQPFVYFHEKQVELAEGVLDRVGICQHEQPACGHDLERVVGAAHHHHQDHHEHAPLAEGIVAGGNYLLMAVSVCLLARGLYRRFSR